MSFALAFTHKFLLRYTINSADKIISISNSVRNEIISTFRHLNSDKVSTIYYAVDNQLFKPLANKHIQKGLSEKFGIIFPFILSVTSFEWRKNIDGLIKAFLNLKNRESIPHKLVIIAGRRQYSKITILQIIKRGAFF
jgi:Glycosyl transferases group 1.